ncbi:hypothetical protein LDENG_00126280 [Lucifuga dentata]|nr:hypothetical protein LDENG_00126280 [Lucifuga dentata]
MKPDEDANSQRRDDNSPVTVGEKNRMNMDEVFGQKERNHTGDTERSEVRWRKRGSRKWRCFTFLSSPAEAELAVSDIISMRRPAWDVPPAGSDASRPDGHVRDVFDEFVQATTCRAVLHSFGRLCEHLQLSHAAAERPLYHAIKRRLNYWKANALWAKLDARASHQEYMKDHACADTTCVVVGAGPCGLRTAVELGFMGARVVLLEKRDSFSRNTVLHLWPFTIHDLRGLGAKKLYGKFCAGSIDHIKVGWRMELHPKSHPVSQLEFDVIVGADGRRNTLPGFRRKEFRGKLAIAITANFKNRKSTAEAKVEEISGVAFIFNQRFFQELRRDTGVDLENIVYYKDDTHYFVMTAKKQSLLDKGVILRDFADTELLLSPANVDQNALQAFAQHAAMIRQRHGRQLLLTLVGDSLLEPFWPMGTGVARGFLAALDSAWMIRCWALGGAAVDVLAERESLYRLLPQTTPENMHKNIRVYTVDPATRYANAQPLLTTAAQVRHLVDTGEEAGLNVEEAGLNVEEAALRQESSSQSSQLLSWCQEQMRGYRGVAVSDLTTSWKSGLALCALIHRHRPDLIDFGALDERAERKNAQLGFDVAEREFGISPVMTAEEMSSEGEPDALSMVMYLSRFYQLFNHTPPTADSVRQTLDVTSALMTPDFLLSRFAQSPSCKRSAKCGDSQSFEEGRVGGSRVRLIANQLQAKFAENSSFHQSQSVSAAAALCRQYIQMYSGGVSSLAEQIANQLQSQEEVKSCSDWRKSSVFQGSSNTCFFCQKRVYMMERLSAEGLFFHRSCFRCQDCCSALRPAAYAYHAHSRTDVLLPAALQHAKQEEICCQHLVSSHADGVVWFVLRRSET